MSDIQQPKLVLDEETSRLARFKKSLRKPRKDEVVLGATIFGVYTAGVGAGLYLMNKAWKTELSEFLTDPEDYVASH